MHLSDCEIIDPTFLRTRGIFTNTGLICIHCYIIRVLQRYYACILQRHPTGISVGDSF